MGHSSPPPRTGAELHFHAKTTSPRLRLRGYSGSCPVHELVCGVWVSKRGPEKASLLPQLYRTEVQNTSTRPPPCPFIWSAPMAIMILFTDSIRSNAHVLIRSIHHSHLGQSAGAHWFYTLHRICNHCNTSMSNIAPVNASNTTVIRLQTRFVLVSRFSRRIAFGDSFKKKPTWAFRIKTCSAQTHQNKISIKKGVLRLAQNSSKQ